MSSRTSAARPPDFFVDRSLGKVTADRLRDHELAALAADSFLFCVSRGNLTLAGQADWIIDAAPRMERAILSGRPGFWSIYTGGRIERRWPRD